LLTAGALTARLDAPDLTHVRLGGFEIVRRIVISVRDVNWDTLEPDVHSCSVVTADGRVESHLEGRHVAGDIDFRWRLSIRIDVSGTLVYEMEGEAASQFLYNRVGLCVLHPVATCAGAQFRSHSKSAVESGVLPVDIAPQVVVDGIAVPLFPACDALVLKPPGGGEISFAFEGDLFEMEDQRNWTDDSFKTYCTPASLGGPHKARAGQRFHQRIEVAASGFDIRVSEPEQAVTVTLGQPSGTSMPPLGLAMGSDGEVLTSDQATALRRLGLAHVRADVKLDPETLDFRLGRAIEICNQLDTALELALHLEPTDERLLEHVEQLLRRRPDTKIARVLAFHRTAKSETPTETSSPALINLVGKHLGDLAPVGGGTNMDFAELNRRRPDAATSPIVAWSTNAQVHASDDASVMETVRGQAATVVTARGVYPSHTLAVGPITLRPRFNPAATGPPIARDPDALPAHVDPRQPTQFAAAWTAASIAALAGAGADSLTYFELVGPAGVIGDQNLRYPSFKVFEALTPLRGESLIACIVSQPEEVAALAIPNYLLLANLTPTPKAVQTAVGAPEPLQLKPYDVMLLKRDGSSAWTA
jgi:D-apionolactonase